MTTVHFLLAPSTTTEFQTCSASLEHRGLGLVTWKTTDGRGITTVQNTTREHAAWLLANARQRGWAIRTFKEHAA